MTNSRKHCIECDGQTLKALAEAGKNWLEVNYERVNELNVFPVPDGDTGINMLLTMRNAYQEVAANASNNAGDIAGGLSYGAIMGSRGNSGTIMSQIWVGFADALAGRPTFNVMHAAESIRQAAEKAYSGVQTPVEGTILTIIREVADEAEVISQETTNFLTFMEKLVARAWLAVEGTPDLLPILKEANVVDSGGTGLAYILEGMLKYMRGEDIAKPESFEDAFEKAVMAHDAADTDADLAAFADEEYNYDVQFVIKGEGLPVEIIKNDIEAMGDSGVIIGDSRVVKVHIHVDDPSVPIGYGVKLGILHDVVVENMQAQYEALLAQKQARQAQEVLRFQPVAAGDVGVIAVAPGKGIAKVFAELGVGGIIAGGQTNNPSTADILAAAQSLQTDKVIVLPNNKNIILAAKQAAEHSDDITLTVLPTRTVPQGIAAMVAYRPTDDIEALFEEMEESFEDVISAEITTAVRSVELDGVAVEEGQIIGLVNGQLRVAGDSIETVVFDILDEIELDEAELITLYYGDHIALPVAEKLAGQLAERYADLEFEVVWGGQPHYHYIVSIE